MSNYLAVVFVGVMVMLVCVLYTSDAVKQTANSTSPIDSTTIA